MLRDKAVEKISRLVSNRPDKRADIEQAIVTAQAELESPSTFVPWFLETENSSSVTLPNEERVLLPSDFIAEKEEDALWLLTENGGEVLLRKKPLDLIRLAYPTTEREQPIYYSISGGYIRLRPIPSKAYGLRMIYFAHDVPPSSNIENKWLRFAEDWLIGRAGNIVATEIGHQVAMGYFKEEEQLGRRRCYVDTESRLHTNQVYYLGT